MLKGTWLFHHHVHNFGNYLEKVHYPQSLSILYCSTRYNWMPSGHLHVRRGRTVHWFPNVFKKAGFSSWPLETWKSKSIFPNQDRHLNVSQRIYWFRHCNFHPSLLIPPLFSKSEMVMMLPYFTEVQQKENSLSEYVMLIIKLWTKRQLKGRFRASQAHKMPNCFLFKLPSVVISPFLTTTTNVAFTTSTDDAAAAASVKRERQDRDIRHSHLGPEVSKN